MKKSVSGRPQNLKNGDPPLSYSKGRQEKKGEI